jgi:endoglucanase
MKKFLLLILYYFLLFNCNLIQSQDIKPVETSGYHKWWEDKYFRFPKPNPDAKKLSLISVKANKFVNQLGDTILFRGLSVGDPDKLENEGYWNKDHFLKVKEMGATIVRIPVHPIAWRERAPEKYLDLLDKAVEWCTELEMYIIIDWHSIGNLITELFQNPMYNTTRKETFEFWRTISGHFRGHNTVAFYEIFNEPTDFRGMLGPVSWNEWKKINEDIISLIRAYDKEKIPLVAGFDWAYDLTPLLLNPISADRIGYVTHPYPNKRSQPWEPKWEENFGFASGKYPIIATEIGFNTNTENYGTRIINYLESKGISWTAWVFDPEWHPQMFKSWDNYELTECGEFFKKALLGQIIKKN